jgi:hypothetical protein
MTLAVKHIHTNYCAQTWPIVAPFIAEAHKYGGGDYSMDQIQMYVNLGNWVLLVAVDENNVVHGAGTVSFINYPTSRVAFFTTIGGRLISNQDTFNQLKTLLKSMGATKIQGAVRDSMARLLRRYSFVKRYTVVQSDI